MRNTAAVGYGCFEANYPMVAWRSMPCATGAAPPEVVGGGGTNDWSTQEAGGTGYSLTGYSAGFASETGFSSESDSVRGPGYYSVQGNSNTYGLVYQGRATTAWTQFVFVANDNGCCPYSEIFIQWWLIGYGTCPGGWTAYGNDCYISSSATQFGYYGPQGLAAYGSWGGGSSGGGLDVQYCAGSNCWTTDPPDTLSLLQSNHWQVLEWNVFGYCCSSRANFNAGVSLSAYVTPSDTTGIHGPEVTCARASYTGETNNLNLGSCSVQIGITFSESD